MLITIKMLEARINYLNKIMGRPIEPWKTVNGKNIAQIGNCHLYQGMNRFSVHCHVNEGGGVHVLFGAKTKRELLTLIEAYTQGYVQAKQNVKDNAMKLAQPLGFGEVI